MVSERLSSRAMPGDRRSARALFLAFTLLSAPLLAQDPPQPPPREAQGTGIEVTPQFVYRLDGNVETDFADDLVSDDAEVEAGAAFGLTVSIPLNDWFQVEFLARSQDTELVLDGGLFGRPAKLGDLSIEHYHVGALIQWGSGQVEPFFAGSLGLARLDLDRPGAATEEKLSGSIGGGAKVMFSQRFGLRLEGRWFWTNLGSDGSDDRCRNDFDDDDDCFHYNDDGIYQGEASVGLLFRF